MQQKHLHMVGNEPLSLNRLFPSNPTRDQIKTNSPTPQKRLVGLVVRASASRAEDPGFESCLRRDFFGVESYQ